MNERTKSRRRKHRIISNDKVIQNSVNMTINFSLKWKQAFCQNRAQNFNTIDYPKMRGNKERCWSM
jgi:hypothetical protein